MKSSCKIISISLFLMLLMIVFTSATEGDYIGEINLAGTTEHCIDYYDGYLYSTARTEDVVYKLYPNGTETGNTFGITDLVRGLTNNGTYFWTLDYTNGSIHKYQMDGTYTGDAYNSTLPNGDLGYGITTDGTYFWVADRVNSVAIKYYMNWTYTGTNFTTNVSENRWDSCPEPRGITTDGNYIWVVSSTIANQNRTVCKFDMNGDWTEITWSADDVSDIDQPYDMGNNGSVLWIADPNSGKAFSFEIESEVEETVEVSITSPTNYQNTSDSEIDVEYTLVTEILDSCWYSNDTMSLNISLGTGGNCLNITDVTWTDGQHNVTVWANDTSSNIGSSSVTFITDISRPYFVDVGNIFIDDNVSLSYDVNATDLWTGIDSFSINWSNNFTINSVNGTISNSTKIYAGEYYVNITINDSVNNINSTVILINVSDDYVNDPPYQPTNVLPVNGSTYQSLDNQTGLSVTVSDEELDALNVTFYGYEVGSYVNTTENFTIVVFPDTQVMSASSTEWTAFQNMSKWVNDSWDDLNIQLVLHVGDIVDNASDTDEWDRANASLSVLDDSNRPYLVTIGNHDSETGTTPDNKTNFERYFGEWRFNESEYWGGDLGNNTNTYYLMNISGNQMGFLTIQWGYDEESYNVFEWVNSTLTNHSDYNFIINTHDFVDGSGTSETGQDIWDQSLKFYENVIAVVNGHNSPPYDYSYNLTGENGNNVIGILTNYQSAGADATDGHLKVLEFDPQADKVFVKTYNVETETYYPDDISKYYTFDFDMIGNATESDYVLLNSTSEIVSGSIINYTWSGMNDSQDYLWYVTIDDGEFVTYSDNFTFTYGYSEEEDEEDETLSFCTEVISGYPAFFVGIISLFVIMAVGIMIFILTIIVKVVNGEEPNLSFIENAFDVIPVQVVLYSILVITLLVWTTFVIFGSLCS